MKYTEITASNCIPPQSHLHPLPEKDKCKYFLELLQPMF